MHREGAKPSHSAPQPSHIRIALHDEVAVCYSPRVPLHIPPPDPILGVGLLCNLMNGADRRPNLATQNPIHLCHVCAKPVDLGMCKTDDHGQAVHDDCYVSKLTLERVTEAPVPPTEN